MIGPSGCGKSTFLRCLNRMNDTIEGAASPANIRSTARTSTTAQDVVQLRARVGMVFQKPNPFPKSIYENVAYGPRIHGLAANRASSTRSSRTACAGRPVGRGEGPAEQARAPPVRRPAAAPVHRARHRRESGSDPDGRALLGAGPDRHRAHRGSDRRTARQSYAIVIVTHSMQQAARVSQRTAYFHLGDLVEVGDTTIDLHQPARQADRRLHHRPLRLTSSAISSPHDGEPGDDHRARAPAVRRQAISSASATMPPTSPKWSIMPQPASICSERDSDHRLSTARPGR
jgi:phosphate transport system ATP-binding protein